VVREYLVKNKIKPLYNRVKVLEYLIVKQNHPTVDEIYNNLVKELPTLSKTTVYNTLKLFLQANLVRLIAIEDNETRYDVIISNHGHFKCEECKEIYDFTIDIDSVETEELKQFKIKEKSVYYKGICPNCLNNN
jgi:Fur family peroxide stress response transcriptional regulator